MSSKVLAVLCNDCPVAPFQRERALESMARTTYDLVVVGAGMTGAGVALDAASRGLRVALIDSGDIASGTSSKSSKMVHGGLRYLQQREFRLVYENLRERQRLLENAPFLVRPLPFLVPLFGRNGVASKALVKGYSTALRIYELSGGWRIGRRHRKITRDQALAHLPTLKTDRLVAGFLYFDARGDDARVALAIAKTAALDFGADVATYVRCVDIVHDDTGRAKAVTARDHRTNREFTINTSSVVNATGVWADDVFTIAEHTASHRIIPAKGVHLSVSSERLPADVAAVLSVPGERRSIFVVPFEGADFTYIGTTDTAYDGDFDEPHCTPDDVEYLLSAVNASTTSDLTTADVTGLWAGLRPLLAPVEGKVIKERTADLSRRHQVTDTGDGVVHITGGKWTTYRQMAEDTVDALRPYVTGLKSVRTKNLRFHGVGPWRPTSDVEVHLYERFGEDARVILDLIAHDERLAERPIEGQPYVAAEFVYSARFEMTTSLIDLLTRRTRADLLDARATLAGASRVAALVADELGWDANDVRRELDAYGSLVQRVFSAAGLPL
ncbi:MAG TPA: glycerol-3-phosphate dehydrogenase/oxidase [Acidimicrobiales bacterium]|nr:glycerol-3-phosphate dehydrogenase/oxidase [Acidimicrobiales bacterium]